MFSAMTSFEVWGLGRWWEGWQWCCSWCWFLALEWFGCGCSHRHALALAHASRGGKGKRWVPSPCRGSDSWIGKGGAQRRSCTSRRRGR